MSIRRSIERKRIRSTHRPISHLNATTHPQTHPSPARPRHTLQLTPSKGIPAARFANAPHRGTQLHPRCVVNADATDASLSDAWPGAPCPLPATRIRASAEHRFGGRVVAVGVHTLRLVASALLAALARSRSASTSSSPAPRSWSQAPTRAKRTLKRYPRAVPYGGSEQQNLLVD
jgi:hypothetical protein